MSTTTIAFAPDLGCVPVSASFMEWNRWAIPIELGSWELVEVQRGEPDPKLFEIPAGYRIVEP